MAELESLLKAPHVVMIRPMSDEPRSNFGLIFVEGEKLSEYGREPTTIPLNSVFELANQDRVVIHLNTNPSDTHVRIAYLFVSCA